MHAGDNPLHPSYPPSPPPSNGGELLLRLVQNRHQNYQQSESQQPRKESPYNLLDPVIAAVGPTVPTPFHQQGYFGNPTQTASFFSAPHKHFDQTRRQQQQQSTANSIQYGPIEVGSNRNDNNHNGYSNFNGFDSNSRLDTNSGNGYPDRRRPGPPPGFLNKFGNNQRRDLEGFSNATTTQYGPTEARFSGNLRRDFEGYSNAATTQYGPTEAGFSRNPGNQRRDLEGFNNLPTQYGPTEAGFSGNQRRDLERFKNATTQYGLVEAYVLGNLRREDLFNNATTQYGSTEAGILGNLRRDIEVMKNAAAKSAITTQYGSTEVGFSSNHGNQSRDFEGFNGPIEVGFSGNQRRDFEGFNNAAAKTSQYGPTKVGFLNNGGFELNSMRSHEKETRFSSRDTNGDSSSNVDGGVGLSGQIDHPGLPSGSSLHSVPTSNLDDNEVGLDDGIDDLSEQLVGSVLDEDQSDEKNVAGGKKKFHRDKDFRSDARGKWILSQRMRNSRSLIECRRDIDRLDSQFLAIYESLMPVEEEIAKQKQLLSLLEQHVCKEWPNAKLYLYGSCANSFGFPKSDIDVCLAIDDQDINKSEMLLKLADILQSGNFQDVQALTRARVPIVKLMDPVTGIACDICINNVLAVVNTKLLRDYAEIDVRLRQLAYLVKHWAKSRGVNETYHGTLSSYAYVLMCIHFLQLRNPPILPCLQNMRSTYSVTVEDIECSFFDQVEKLRDFGARNKENISRLLWGFFSYWAYCHDYANKVISVRSGCILSKQEKDWTRRIGNDRHLICIEDPFETSHDLGRVVDKHSIRVLREEFERAAEIMQYDPNPCVALFEPYIPR